MEAVSQPGTRVSAPPRMSSQSPGTKLTVGHEAPHTGRSPRLAASIPTIGRSRSGHYRLRPFSFHPDVSRSPRATFTPGSSYFVEGSDRLPGQDAKKRPDGERCTAVP